MNRILHLTRAGLVSAAPFATACTIALALHGTADAADGPFEGHWSVVLNCADTTSERGVFAKGYTFAFPSEVHDGRLDGIYGQLGQPSSVRLTGRVAADGALELLADGLTGDSGYTLGRIARGSAYHYTMTGRLAGLSGEAVRREQRPCSATFAKVVP